MANPATGAVADETYFAMTAHEGGTNYSSVSADWTDQSNNQNSDAHTDIFMNDAAGHLAADLPSITITRDNPPGIAYCFLVACGDTSNASVSHIRGNDGNGDNPHVGCNNFTPSLGALLLIILTIDNDGTLGDYTGVTAAGYVLLGSSGAYGAHSHSYVFAKFPSTSDGPDGNGQDDRFNFYVDLVGSNIHWAISYYDINGLGSTQGAYIIDKGLMGTSGNTKTFTASQHGSFPVAPSNLTVPTVAGTAKTGQTLTATTGTWAGSPTPTLTWQWYTGDDVTIGGATASTFVVTDTQHGKTIYVKQTATNTEGSANANSTATSAAVYATPANTVLPAVTGTAKVGEVLTCSSGTWTGTGIAYTYQWKLGDGTSIGGATNNTFTPTNTQHGLTVKCAVTATSDGGVTTATSSATAAVVYATPINDVDGTITGDVKVNETLTVHDGTWTGSGIAYTYQWRRCDEAGSSCSNISAQTASTYVVTSDDIGSTIRCVITGTNDGGTDTSTTSATTEIKSTKLPMYILTANNGD